MAVLFQNGGILNLRGCLAFKVDLDHHKWADRNEEQAEWNTSKIF